MADFVFNIAKGRVAELAKLAAAADALLAIPLEAAGIETDAVLRDKDTFADVVSGATNEQTTLGRKTLTGVTVTTDDATDTVKVDCDDWTWTAAAGSDIAAVVICYDADTGAGTDADLVPLVKLDLAYTPSGADLPVQVGASGLYTAS